MIGKVVWSWLEIDLVVIAEAQWDVYLGFSLFRVYMNYFFAENREEHQNNHKPK